MWHVSTVDVGGNDMLGSSFQGSTRSFRAHRVPGGGGQHLDSRLVDNCAEKVAV